MTPQPLCRALTSALRPTSIPRRRKVSNTLESVGPGDLSARARQLGLPALDLALLEDRTLFSGNPVVLDAHHVDSVEDAPNTEIDLRELMSLDDDGGDVQYELVGNSNESLFAEIQLSDVGELTLDYADDEFGLAELTLQATDASGNVEQLSVNVDLESINDSPTVHSLHSVTVVDLEAGQTVIDLFAAFDDMEDADEDLRFELAENTNPDLFSSITVDMERGSTLR